MKKATITQTSDGYQVRHMDGCKIRTETFDTYADALQYCRTNKFNAITLI